MKKIERGTIKYLVLLIIATAVCGMIIYPLLDLAYYKLIKKAAFSYSFYKHVTQPILFAVVYGITFWSVDKKRK